MLAGCLSGATVLKCLETQCEARERHVPRKEIIVPKGIPQPGLPFSLAIKFGNTVYVAGQPGIDPATGAWGKGVRDQTRIVLERIKTILEEAGTSLDNVLTATCWLPNKDDFAAFNEEYMKYFPDNRPSRATVEATMVSPEGLVEIMVTACVPD